MLLECCQFPSEVLVLGEELALGALQRSDALIETSVLLHQLRLRRLGSVLCH
jgi:hypothetical protein